MRVLLVGNPNTGKTTLFNTLTSSNAHTGNWHGVTVEEKISRYSFQGRQLEIVDLPGIYSLCPYSYEEEVSCNYISSHSEDLILCTCDQNNLRKNLYLVFCLLERGLDVIVAVNRIGNAHNFVDFSKLSSLLGTPVLVVDGKDKKDCEKINMAIVAWQKQPFKKFEYLEKIDLSPVEKWKNSLQKWEQISLLEDNQLVKERLGTTEEFGRCAEVAKARYDFIDSILLQCGFRGNQVLGKSKLDRLFLNKFLAIPLFFAVLGVVFYLTFFSVGKWVSSLLEFLLSWGIFNPISNVLKGLFGSQSWVCGMFDNAICGGVGMVASFLPQVGLLMLFLSILEESGYLSRVAFLFDDLLSKVGLSGKAVYALLMGFGCSTTAVLSARTADEKNAKIKTALLCPYMSCSAKFPIYAVVGGAMFGAGNIWVIMGLYLLGVVIALALSMILEKTILKSKNQSFLLEFPAYRMMGVKKLFSSLWQGVKTFLIKVGGVIILMNVVLWMLSNFTFSIRYVGQGGESILKTFGRMLSPIFLPLGFGGWAVASSLIAGIFAKEVIVSSIALFNGVEGAGLEALQSSILSLSALCSFPSSASVLSFLCFALLYFPCVSTILVMKKEIGTKWTIFGCAMQFALAYLVSFMVYNITYCCEIFGFIRVLVFLIMLVAVALAFALLGKKIISRRCPYRERCSRKCRKK